MGTKWERGVDIEQAMVVALLSGGVAGGVVSGGINLIADTLNRRHERRTLVRGERREIYLSTIQMLAESRQQLDQVIVKGPEAAPLRFKTDEFNQLNQQLTALGAPEVLEMVGDFVKTMLELAFTVHQHFEARSQQVNVEVLSELWTPAQKLRNKMHRPGDADRAGDQRGTHGLRGWNRRSRLVGALSAAVSTARSQAAVPPASRPARASSRAAGCAATRRRVSGGDASIGRSASSSSSGELERPARARVSAWRSSMCRSGSAANG